MQFSAILPLAGFTASTLACVVLTGVLLREVVILEGFRRTCAWPGRR
jgi:hypothetical protein